jgi:hypothetical protein
MQVRKPLSKLAAPFPYIKMSTAEPDPQDRAIVDRQWSLNA